MRTDVRPTAGASRLAAATARLLTVSGVLLPILMLGALAVHAAVPVWVWPVALPDMAGLTVLAVVRKVPRPPTFRPFGS